MTPEVYEKLGAFYLGALWNAGARARTDAPLLYDARDLTTHAVCVGMTGSGKTGLCISLLEEAAIDGVPAIAIDPKGDLGNLLLTFPDLRPEDFRPWVDEGEAARKGMSPDDYAADRAALWTRGLADWGEDGARIGRFRDAVDLAIYTPGSRAGLPLSALRSLTAPPPSLRGDEEALRDRIAASVSGLLALVGIDGDPLRSREHILVSMLLDRAWRGGRDLDLARLIHEIQSPPFERIGVMDVESFFPAKARFDLAMALNGLLASPGFAPWLEGEPMDVERLLYTEQGRPRLSVISIAHLSDAERMFCVTLLLNEIVAWMRAQSGTTSLRALIYMDEVFGFLPPVANPPSKRPLLTMLKQARAYGVGTVLATQNPVDLDYKGLSNAGTWFLGRLQTERDQARVLDGLEGASATAGASFDRARLERTLAGLESRVFLMNNVHEDEPVLFQTRWALSYLRGPLTREQIGTLMAARRDAAGPAEPRPEPAPTAAPPAPAPADAASAPPPVPPDVDQHFVAADDAASGPITYRPALLARARLHHVRTSAGLDRWRDVALVVPLDDAAPDDPWAEAVALDPDALELHERPESPARFLVPPGPALDDRMHRRWGKACADHLYRDRPVTIWQCGALRETSAPDETEAHFRVRLRQLAQERRDEEKARLERRYAKKLRTARDRVRRAEDAVERETDQYEQARLRSQVSLGRTLLGALFGRRLGTAGNVGRAGTAVDRMGRARQQKADIDRAEDALDAHRAALEALEKEFAADVAALDERIDAAALELEPIVVAPRKTDMGIERTSLAWLPYRAAPTGSLEPAWSAPVSP